MGYIFIASEEKMVCYAGIYRYRYLPSVTQPLHFINRAYVTLRFQKKGYILCQNLINNARAKLLFSELFLKMENLILIFLEFFKYWKNYYNLIKLLYTGWNSLGYR